MCRIHSNGDQAVQHTLFETKDLSASICSSLKEKPWAKLSKDDAKAVSVKCWS